ncbi:MAG: hypothetical protein IIZ67_00290 [Bacilli bacterium]|nr:hypothetical protein [Bacilli bacterium]
MNLTLEKFEKRSPKLNNEYYDKLTPKQINNYINLCNKYYSFFIKYLNEIIDLDRIEKIIDKVNTILKPVEENKKDLYQSISPYKYIYIRNNIYIERLTQDELNILTNNNEYNETTKELIINTYPKIINPYIDKDIEMLYGPDSSKFLTSSKNIVLGIRINDNLEADNYTPMQVSNTKKMIINTIKTTIMKNANKNNLNNITLIEYNDISSNI